MFKEFKNIEGEARTELTTETFSDIQNHYIKKIIRHTHSNIPAIHVKIGELGDATAPVGLELPTEEGKILSWQDHVNLDHSASFSENKLIARGWTIPIKARFIITTPIFDSTSNVPFPTYNMNNIGINKDLSSSESFENISSNRHNPNTYSVYRHYLYLMPMNGVANVNPVHKEILSSQNSVIFAKPPLYIHPSNETLLGQISNYQTAPNFRNLTYIPDYTEEKVWSITEDSTCWMSGYKSIVAKNSVVMLFNDHYNEFNQVFSTANYEERNREYLFRWDKAPANLSRKEFHNLSDITKLMNAKTLDVLGVDVGGGLVRDSINKQYSPFSLIEYNFKLDKETSRVKQTLLSSCMEKSGKNIVFYKKGLYNFASFNSNTFLKELTFPNYFDDGYRQCLTITLDLGASKRSFKKIHKGLVSLVYQVIDGYFSIPYEIYSTSSKIATVEEVGTTLTGAISNRNYVDVTK